ncbi:MAG TPA: hypothetical protein VE398_11300 [Acidobacteriota bacterium]|nr:hypothetical protein [Acidobacteriota bacterium]
MRQMSGFSVRHPDCLASRFKDDSAFSLVEFLIASFVILLISAAVFNMLVESQRTASYQTEVQAVLDNSRLAMETVERHLRQAGNDPYKTGIIGISIAGADEITLKSDLTGSAGTSDPDKGDPDGDISDAAEDVTIRYNAASRSIEIVPAGGSAQTIAVYITAFSMRYFDGNGVETTAGASVRRVNVTVSGASTIPNPQTEQVFGVTLTSDVQIATRQY